MAIHLPTPGSKGRTFKLCVLTRWDLISASAAPHCGDMHTVKAEMASLTNRFDRWIHDVRNKTDSDMQTLNARLSSYMQILGNKIDQEVQQVQRHD